jgi:hypothetical protein
MAKALFLAIWAKVRVQNILYSMELFKVLNCNKKEYYNSKYFVYPSEEFYLIDIQRFSSYSTLDSNVIRYEDKSANDVYGNNGCML